ncbi:MAG TPA: hypothetical protein VFZ83_07680 [Acidimicrobiia bacterium]|nr:hypothetical protein [Acidimicrobiia bacterium]
MEPAPAVRFAELARRITAAARAAGLVTPAFRSPPRHATAVRTIRRLPGGPVVSVRIRSRTPAQVASDMIDGVLAANRLQGDGAARVRAQLVAAVRGGPPSPPTVAHPARVAERQTQAA